MVRSLWTAANGMIAQQTNVDIIANNLANVNTTGFKAQTAQFKSLLYQTLQTKTTTANGDAKPNSAQVGLGVRTAAISTSFRNGSLQESSSDTAFALEGDGFFAVRGSDGNTYYTRSGDFTWAIGNNNTVELTTSDGYVVLSTTGQPITFSTQTYAANKITISSDGSFYYPDASNNPQPLGVQFGVYQFSNPAGLTREGDNLYAQSAASGGPLNEATNTALTRTKVIQGYLEMSNVQVADEMVNLIVAQRAYEMNSKAITTTDEMMAQANELKR